jgi:integrase
MADLSKVRERARLAIRRSPHYMRLAEGAYLGFRRGPDTWHARYRARDGVQHYRALRDVPADDYDGALQAAQGWFRQLGGSAVRAIRRGTVREALEAYVADLRARGRWRTVTEAERRIANLIFDDPIADLKLERATFDDFDAWRDRLTAGRRIRTINRHVRSVAAGLNRAIELGHVGNVAAWHLRPLCGEEEGEPVFLAPGQRAAIVAAADPYTSAFLRALELTGARPKELAAMTKADFDGQVVKLRHYKGSPTKQRVRCTVLGTDGVAFFADASKGKLPYAPLFTVDGLRPWRSQVWSSRIKEAIERANQTTRGGEKIPTKASAYSFRHARISELLQVHGVDPLTVAQQTGTSVEMIERSYLRFIPSALQLKLATLKT